MIHKTRTKALSWLLSLAMVLSLLPGLSLTAYAATTHGITINTAQHGTVTASVNGSAATSAEEGATVTLTANPENGYRLKSISGTYKGNPQETKGLNGTKTINGTNFNLNATDAAGAGWKLANNSTITITSKDTSVKIDKVDFNISQRGNSFNLNNVSCSAGTKSLNGNTLSVSSINGTAVTLSSSANNAGVVRFNSVTIYGTGAVDTNLSISTTGDVNVRTFTMPAVVQGDVTITPVFEEIPKYSVTLTGGVNAATSGGNTSQTDLTGAMETVTYTANSGYRFPETSELYKDTNGITVNRTSDTVITVSGTPTANADVTIPDAVKPAQMITAPEVTATYGDTDKSVSASVTEPTTGGGAISYTVKDGSGNYIDVAADGKLTIKAVPPTDGKAYVIVTAAGTDTYAETAKEVAVTISKAEVTVTAKNQSIYIGGTVPTLEGEDFYTVSGLVGEDALTTAPTLAYQKDGSAATPDDTTAGTYDIVPSGASAGDNYNISYTNGTLTISEKQAATVTKAPEEAKNLTYNGSAQALVTAGEAEGGEMQYALGTATEATQPYTTTIPTGTDVGTYYVWYKVVGDSSHNDTDPVCVTVTISAPYVPSYSGGDDSSPSTPAATTITVPVSSDTQSVSVTASVSGETATVQKPTTAQLEQIVGESVHTGEVTIDVSGLGKEITTVSIPTETVKAVEQAVNDAANDATGMTVKLSEGSVTFDGQALTAITEQATGNNIQLNLDGIGENKLSNTQQAATKDMDVQAVYDAYITSNGQRISDFKGGKATVTVPYELKAEQRAAGVTVWYVADNGNTTEMPSTYDGKEVKFTVEHFSNYVIAYDEERAAVCPQDSTCPISAFTDADPTAWYHDGVHYVLENGIMSGLGNGQFAPNDTTSRAMLAQILYNMEGKPAIRSGIPFEDVSESDWYAMAISWAESNGIIGGYGNGKFGPNDDLTREQLVTIMYRYAQYKGVDVSVGEDTNILSYDDALTVSEFAIPAMQWAVGSGAVGGRTNTTLNPQDKATRAEIATIIMRYCEEIAR